MSLPNNISLLSYKWREVYNSILRLKFYTYLEITNSKLIKDLDCEFNSFAKKYVCTQDTNLRFFGGNTLIGFSYLVLVRMFEILNKYFDKAQIDNLFKTSDWKAIGINQFSDLSKKYKINIDVLVETKRNGTKYYDSDTDKLAFLMRKIRNAVSHYRYEHPDMLSIRLTDVNGQGQVELDLTMPYADFINFCADMGCIINDTLIKNHFKK
ncbi:MAG: hypothetical protein APR63_11855 [Desulfuromonas sp. SDB]|nr:MAG: hypothetical protein APR63_11855 [Desulfuromonas sp. SDB]